MKRFLLLPLLFCALILAGTRSRAQDAHSLLFSQPGSLRASTLNPASLHIAGDRSLQIGTLGLNTWVNHNGANLPLAARFLSGDFITDEQKDELLGDMPDVMRVNAGANLMSLGAAYQLKNPARMAFSLMVTDRPMASVQFHKNFVDFMLRGNRHLAGQRVDLAQDMQVGINWAREYAVGFATDLPFVGDGETFGLRLGVRAKYLTNHFAAQVQDARLQLYTHPDGEYIDASYDYSLYLTQGDVSPFNSRGGGMGLDLSLQAEINQKLQIGLSLLDVGKLKINKDVDLYRGRGDERYEQLIVGALFWDDRFANSSEEDQRAYPLAPDTLLQQSFDMALPTRLLLNSQLSLGDSEENAFGVDYYRHNLYLAASMLLTEAPGFRKSPFISVAYAYHLKGILRLGGNLSHPGYSPVGFGLFAGLDTGFFQAGIASENLLPLLRKDDLAGGDIMFNLSFSF